MNEMELFKQLFSIFEGDDQPCEHGCALDSVDAMVEAAKRLYPDKPYCTIQKWVWVDLDMTGARRNLFKERGLLPAFVRTDHVIFDEARRPNIGNSVRSTALMAFHKNCIFVTRNTSYILVGSGSRVLILPEVLSLLQEW